MDNVMINQQDQDLSGKLTVSNLGLLLVFLSIGMLFATLFLGLAIYRSTSDQWPPMGLPTVPLLFPNISTILILLSSVTYFVSEKNFKKQMSISRFWNLGTIILGLLFAVSQCLLWNKMHTLGLYTSSGIFASLIYAFTWIHGAHMIVAIGLLFYAIPSFYRGPSATSDFLRVSNVGKFWHFLTGLWLIIYLIIFVF